MGRSFYIRVREQVAFLQIRRGQRCLLTQKTSFSWLDNLGMEAMPLWICSIASAIIAARHGEEGNRNNYLSAHAMPDIQIETEILDTADLCPKPNKNVGRKGERRRRGRRRASGKLRRRRPTAVNRGFFLLCSYAVTHLPLFCALQH